MARSRPPRSAVPTLLALALLAVVVPAAAAGPPPPRPTVWPGTGEGKSPPELFPWARFDPAIPTQAEIVGFQAGARPIRHDELMRYLRALDEASPRAELRPYARSHEGRELVVFAVSAPETIARLDRFREEHRSRVDPRGRQAADDAEVLDDARAVAWVAYGIHGDELSSVDAAAAVAYWLVAGEDDLARRMRDELVVLIDPIENPDGRERFLAQTLSFARAVPSPDTDDISHTTVWPWGRGNHYLFDLNRDWFSMVHPESRRSAVIAGWSPQLVVDSHEMGAHDTYLFSPPRHPFNPHLPDSHSDWSDRFAADQARALDRHGYPYYTREWNEEFFPGYGSSWASYLGAVGVLYEMSGTEGTLVKQRAGTVRTFAQAVDHQVTSSVANLTTLVDHRQAILADFVADRREAIRRGSEGPVGAWVLPRRRYPRRTDALVRLLAEQGIEVLRAGGPRPALDGARDALTGQRVEPGTLDDGAWLVPVDQPAGPLVRALLDPHVPMEAAFFREEREHLERGKGTRLYEVTAWSLPQSYGVEAWWMPRRPAGGWSPAVPGDPPEGAVAGQAEGAFGWLMDGTSDAAVYALADLLQRDVAVRVGEKPFSAGGREYGRSTVLVQREENSGRFSEDGELLDQLRQVADRWGVTLSATPTAKADTGPDLGGSHFRPLVAPRIGVWTGAPVSPSAYGALWHLLDATMRVRFSGLDLSRFGSTDLARYNVLVFPPVFGGSGAYRELLGEEGLERLRRWIAAGGTAIGIAGGAEFLADRETGLTATRLRRQALEDYPPVVLGPSAREVAATGPFRAAGLRPAVPEEDGGEGEGDGDGGARGESRRADNGGRGARDDSGRTAAPQRESAFDVAPLLGPGARPFAEGFEQGRPAPVEPVALSDWLAPLLPPGDEPDEEALQRADARLRRFASRGTFLRVELDSDRWLAWGMPDEISALVRTSSALVAEPPVEVPARFVEPDRLHLGGLLWPEAAGRIAHTAYATREAHGRGQIVLFVTEPEFRGWTLGTRRLLLNALLYGPGLGTRWSHPW